MNRLNDHGRGYTWLSMRSTDRKCRRRIGTRCTSRLASSGMGTGSGTRAATSADPVTAGGARRLFASLEVGLGISLPGIERLQLGRVYEIPSDGAGMRQLDQRVRCRIGGTDTTELEMRDISQHLGIPQRAVTDGQALLVAGHQL